MKVQEIYFQAEKGKVFTERIVLKFGIISNTNCGFILNGKFIGGFTAANRRCVIPPTSAENSSQCPAPP